MSVSDGPQNGHPDIILNRQFEDVLPGDSIIVMDCCTALTDEDKMTVSHVEQTGVSEWAVTDLHGSERRFHGMNVNAVVIIRSAMIAHGCVPGLMPA